MNLSFFTNMKIKGKLFLLLSAFVSGFVIFGLVSYFTIDTVKVHGRHYDRIVQNKDLLADVLPPPAFIVEAYLQCHLMPDTMGTPEYKKAKTEFFRNKSEYEARLEHWKQNLPESKAKAELIDKASRPAYEFFRVVENEMIPAMDKGDREAADIPLNEKLPSLYNEHLASIRAGVEATNKNISEIEADVVSIVTKRTWYLLLTGLFLMGAVCGLTLWIRRSILQQEEKDAENTAKMNAINAAQAVIEFKPDGTILTANDNFLKTVGYSLDEINGKHHSLFVEDSYKHSAEYSEFWAKLNRGENIPGEFRRFGKGGKLIVIQASYNAIPDCSGKIIKVVKYATDITETAKTREEAARVSSMMDQAPINVMFAGLDGKISYANPATLNTLKTYRNLVKVAPEQLLGQPIEIFHSNPDQLRRIVNDPASLPHKTEVILGNEHIELLVSGIYTLNKKYLGAMITWNVITERKQAEQAAKDAAEREKEKAEEMALILNQVNQNASTLGSSAEELTAVSSQMSVNAEETSAQANVVSAAAEQVSKNVQTVATGVDEMNSAIREIAKNASDSARVAQQAVTDAQIANNSISKLGDSSAEIGKVLKVITSIAEQTNLLALNATIEAARAGEAGKGFAVVANEVKELAKETARATEDISRKIETIQGDTQGAVESIRKIGQVIAQINDISNTIASAVEEQTATATEMSRNVAEASKGTAEIAENICSVAQSAQNTTQGATNCQQAAAELARMAVELQQLGAMSHQNSNATPGIATRGNNGSVRTNNYIPIGRA
jgi:PAS domain S-box-containing protein